MVRVLYSGIVSGRRYALNFRTNLLTSLFNLVIAFPPMMWQIEKQGEKIRLECNDKVKKTRKNIVYQMPDRPMKEETILKRMEEGSELSKTLYTNGGNISGAVYIADEDHWDFISDVMRLHITSNPLHSEFTFVN